MCTYMTSINIAIKEEAYEFLRNLKSGDKSFSDVILSFKKDQRSLMGFFGALKDLDWESKERDMKSLRDSFNKRIQ